MRNIGNDNPKSQAHIAPRSETILGRVINNIDIEVGSYGVVWILVAALVLILNFVPVYQMTTNTFKSIDDFNGAGFYEGQGPNPFLIPRRWTLSSVSFFFANTTAPRAFLNNVIVSVVSIVLLVIFGAITALILAQYQIRYTGYLFNFLMGGHAIPRVMTIITIFIITRALAALDTYHGLILVITAQWLPFTIFLFYGYYRGLPRDLLDAAEIDGASFRQIVFRIVLPMSRTIIATVAVLIFMAVWAIYLQGLILIRREDMYILSQIVQNMEHGLRDKQPVFYAGFLLMSLPMMAVAWWAQRYIASGMMAGSVKR